MSKTHYSLTEAAEIKQVRREAIYYAVRHGTIDAEKVGNTFMIPAAALDAYNPRPYRGKRGNAQGDGAGRTEP